MAASNGGLLSPSFSSTSSSSSPTSLLTEGFLEDEAGHFGHEVVRRARGGAELVSH